MDCSRYFLNSDRILIDFWCKKFELFDRSPIESFNPGRGTGPTRGRRSRWTRSAAASRCTTSPSSSRPSSTWRWRRTSSTSRRSGSACLSRPRLSCWWIAVHHHFLMNWWICSSTIDELLHHYLVNFDKLVQKIVTSGNCLQFPEIPTKSSEIFTEKSAISVDLQQFFEKICKNHQHVRKSENFEM